MLWGFNWQGDILKYLGIILMSKYVGEIGKRKYVLKMREKIKLNSFCELWREEEVELR